MTASSLRQIDPETLVPMDLCAGHAPIVIDLMYGRGDHPENLFREPIYHANARCWLHPDMARVTLKAAFNLQADYGWTLWLKDGLRTVEAQQAMAETQIVKANPHWSDGLLSTPGRSAHPRGMAIDVAPVDAYGQRVDMGTIVDELPEDPSVNPCARDYKRFGETVLENRQRLEDAFLKAGNDLGIEVFPLPQEWWDFRLPRRVYDGHAPLYDHDIPPYMRMCDQQAPAALPAGMAHRCKTLLNNL